MTSMTSRHSISFEKITTEKSYKIVESKYFNLIFIPVLFKIYE